MHKLNQIRWISPWLRHHYRLSHLHRFSNQASTTKPTTIDAKSKKDNSSSIILSGVSALRQILDKHIVGHQDTKECILLGLAANEHVFVQGEPGTAKTYAAELAAQTAGLKTYSVQFHRDTRLQDLIGDAIIVRERQQKSVDDRLGTSATPSAVSEIVRQSVERGGLLTAEVAVLDDLTRAPGEALNVLLRILNERTFEEQRLPLRCAIATANAPRDDMYVEPLDPANLDRFALQVKSDSLIIGNDWNAVNQVVDMYQQLGGFGTDGDASDDAEMAKAAKVVASVNVNSVIIGDDVKECFIMFLQWLSNHSAVTPRNSLLTDRTFLVKAPRILRAQAALAGRSEVEIQDMAALRHMTTFRVPATVHEEVRELLKLLAETSPRKDEDSSDDNGDGKGFGGTKDRNRMAGYLKGVLQQFNEGGPRIDGPRGGGSSSSDQSKMETRADQDGEDDELSGSDSSGKSKTKKKKEGSKDDSIDHVQLQH